MGFKRYDGTPIDVPTHKHSVEDTQIGGFTAYASYTNDGFMQKEDRIKLISLKTKMDYLNDRLYNAVYFSEPKSSTLIFGDIFNATLGVVGPNATSIVFTNTAIPSDKISTATKVSTDDSEAKAYMYLDNDTIYVSPEEDNGIIYANEDSSEMFIGYKGISLDLSNFNTSNVTNMREMFQNCTNLTTINGIEDFDTSNVTNMSWLFYHCESLTSLDLSKWNIDKVVSMQQMFYFCISLKTLNIFQWDKNNNCISNELFAYCRSLVGEITISNPNKNYPTDILYYACINAGAKVTLNYVNNTTKTFAENIINKKYPSNSNVVLGTQV